MEEDLEPITKEGIRDLEAALRRFGYGDTLAVIQKEEEVRRSDGIEKAIDSLRKGNDNIRQQLGTISQEDARRDFEAVNGRLIELANKRVAKSSDKTTFEAAMAAVTLERPDLYEEMLKKRQVLILTKAAIEKAEKVEKAVDVPDTPTGRKLAQMAKELADREGMNFDAAWFRVKAEYPDLEIKLLIEINEGMK
jgi:hypothetical protein